MSRPVSSWNAVEPLAQLRDRLVRAVEGRAEDADDADRVLVAELHGLLGREVEAVALHRHEPHLDVPVVGELLPADLDVDPHHEVRLVRRLALGLAPFLPPALEREAAQHRRLARPGRRTSGRLTRVGRVPEVAQDRDTARLELGRLRVLVLVDHVLVEALGHQLLGLRLHPRRDERGHVEPRVAVEHQLVVDDLVRDVRRHLAGWELITGNRSFAAEQRIDRELAGRCWLGRVLERHGSPLLGSTRRYTSRRAQYFQPAENGTVRSPTPRSRTDRGAGARDARADRRRDRRHVPLARLLGADVAARPGPARVVPRRGRDPARRPHLAPRPDLDDHDAGHRRSDPGHGRRAPRDEDAAAPDTPPSRRGDRPTRADRARHRHLPDGRGRARRAVVGDQEVPQRGRRQDSGLGQRHGRERDLGGNARARRAARPRRARS